jgi:hypothetical protein
MAAKPCLFQRASLQSLPPRHRPVAYVERMRTRAAGGQNPDKALGMLGHESCWLVSSRQAGISGDRRRVGGRDGVRTRRRHRRRTWRLIACHNQVRLASSGRDPRRPAFSRRYPDPSGRARWPVTIALYCSSRTTDASRPAASQAIPIIHAAPTAQDRSKRPVVERGSSAHSDAFHAVPTRWHLHFFALLTGTNI